jgi:6-phosphogluconate dehydrogenase
MKKKLYDWGMIGLGTMGRNLVYNICDHGYSVADFLIISCRCNVIISEPMHMRGRTGRALFIPNGIKNIIRNGYKTGT